MNKLYGKGMRAEQGFLSIIAVLLIVVVGFIGLVVTYMIAGSASATNNFAQAENALYAAEAGFEEAARLLSTPVLTGSNSRIACTGITGNGNLTNTSFGSGTFTASTVAGSPYYVNTTLSGALTSSGTTVPVVSTAGFAAAGRLIIDREVMSYGGISGNSFIAVQRGINQSVNTPHASGAYAAQYQCNVDVKGGLPNLSSPLYQREIQQDLQLQEGWAAGNNSGSSFVLTRWNRPTELSWTNSALSSASDAVLTSISMLSNAEGWSVGNVLSAKFTLLHWTASSWTLLSPTACAGQNLLGVSAVYSNEAWAVGVTSKSDGSCGGGGTRRYTILYWNGSTWTQLTPSTSIPIPADNKNNTNLNAVHVIDTTQSGKGTLGFAVGDSGVILQYSGSSWTTATSPTTKNLFGVYVVSASEAWAVGQSGTILKWNGSTWAAASSPTANQLNGIVMLDASLSGSASSGWAVGNAGTTLHYNGSAWSSVSSGSGANLFGVDMFLSSAAEDAWAVGASGAILHYNGSAWSSVSSGVTQQLNGISLIKPESSAFAWQEIFA